MDEVRHRTHRDFKSFLVKDPWLIIGIIVVVGFTAWNILSSQTPTGYNRYSDYGISLLHPRDLNPWHVAINDDGSVVQDGSRMPSEDWGFIGWNTGNTVFERPERDGYYQESGVLWLRDGASSDDVELSLYYTMQETTNLLRNRECNITAGYSGYFTHSDHRVKYDFFNYTVQDAGETDKVTVYGIVGGFYCDKSGRSFELYYLDIYDFDPEYDEEALFDAFNFLFKYFRCH